MKHIAQQYEFGLFPSKCAHKWAWTLRDGTIWSKPINLNNYDDTLIIGKCLSCGAIHKPKKI